MGVKVNGLISEVFGIRTGAVGTPTGIDHLKGEPGGQVPVRLAEQSGQCVRNPYSEG